MTAAFAIFHALLILFMAVLLAKRWSATYHRLYWLSLACHLIAGIAVGLVYVYYYTTNDTWLFFADAKKTAAVARVDITSYFRLLVDFSYQQNIPGIITTDFRSLIFVKLLSILSLVTHDNYWTSTLYFSFFSFAASWFLFRKVIAHFEGSTPAAALAFLFFPSVVFWSSGIEKESLTLAALYFLAGVFLQIFLDKKVDKSVVVLVIIASAILWALKYYWAGVFFISALSTYVLQKLSTKNLLIKNNLMVSYVISFALIGVAVSFLHPNFYLHRFLEVLVVNHDAFVLLSNDSNLIHFYNLKPTISSVVINSPWALISGVFRPFVGEGQGGLVWVASTENLLILGLFVTRVWNLKSHFFNKPIHLFTLGVVSYCIVLCVFLALSTPNLGTLSRYRVGFLPFLIFILAYKNKFFDAVIRKLRADHYNQ